MVTVNKKEQVKLSNQSLIYEVFGDNEKLLVAEVLDRANEKLKQEVPPSRVSQNTVRRAIEALVEGGFLHPYGRIHNAMVYGKPGAGFNKPDANLIPYAGELKSVKDFIQVMTAADERPLTRKSNIVGEKTQHAIRRQLVYAIMSASDPGYTTQLKKVNENLHGWVEDLRYLLVFLESFLNSPVWYEQYRDKIGYSIREMQKEDPELFKLAIEYIKGE